MTRRVILLALALCAARAGRAYGDGDDNDDGDSNRARRAVEEGHALPLAELLRKVQAELGGEVIGVKLKSKNGRLVYKLKIVTSAGRLQEISVDAANGELITTGDD